MQYQSSYTTLAKCIWNKRLVEYPSEESRIRGEGIKLIYAKITFVNVGLEENTSLVYPSILDRNNKWEGYRTYLCSNSGAYASHPPFVVGKFLS